MRKWRRLLPGGHRTELVRLGEVVADRPVLGDTAVLQTEDVRPLDSKSPTARWDALELTTLRSLARRIGDHTIVFGDQLFQFESKVRKRLEQPGMRCLESFTT